MNVYSLYFHDFYSMVDLIVRFWLPNDQVESIVHKEFVLKSKEDVSVRIVRPKKEHEINHFPCPKDKYWSEDCLMEDIIQLNDSKPSQPFRHHHKRKFEH